MSDADQATPASRQRRDGTVARLRPLVERIGADRITRSASLARNVLRDTFPDHPLVVSLLTLAVEQGVGTQLVEQVVSVPVPILGPRLAARLSDSTGVGAAQARWATAAWAASLGLLPEAPAWPPSASEATDAGDLFETRAAPLTDTGAGWSEEDGGSTVAMSSASASSVASETSPRPERIPDDVVPTERLVTAPTDRFGLDRSDPRAPSRPATTPPPAGGRERLLETVVQSHPTRSDHDKAAPGPVPAAEETVVARPVPVAAAAGTPPTPPGAAAAHMATASRPPAIRRRWPLLVAVAVAFVVLAGGVLAWRTLAGDGSASVSARAGTAGFVIGADGRQRIGSAPLHVQQSDTISASRGPLEANVGASVLRLDDGSSVRVEGDHDFRVLTGRVFVDAASSAPVVLEAGSTSTTVRSGRLVASCSTTCRFQALDEGQSVRLPDGAALALTAHRVVTVGSQGPVGAVAMTAPDALRADDWIQSNDALDHQQRRPEDTIEGRSVLGPWIVTVHRSDLPEPFDRQITFSTSCSSTGCALTAVTLQHDYRDKVTFIGAVTASDAAGDHLSVAYPKYHARCAYPGQSDGTERLSDTLVISGSGGRSTVAGERTTQYTPVAGSRCSGAEYTAAITSSLTGAPGALPAERSTNLEQQLVYNYVRHAPRGCTTTTTASAPQAGLQTDLVCKYDGAPDRWGVARPATVELAVYENTRTVEAAYRSALRSSPAADTGDCTVGPCETAFDGGNGRLQQTGGTGTGRLIAYDWPTSNLLVIATNGASPVALHRWWDEQSSRAHDDWDISVSPIPRVGL